MIIDAIWRRYGGKAKYFCVSTRSAADTWENRALENNSGLGRELKKIIDDNLDKDIWFCPSGFDRPARQGEYVHEGGRLLWADMDEVDPRKLSGALRPSIAIESSPGRYVGLWICDKPTNDRINRRLTRAIGADKGGWDYSQLLRMPGSKNFKYRDTMPTVRLLWSDGPEVRLDELLEILPPDDEIPSDLGDAVQIIERYYDAMPRPLRQELADKRPPAEGKRSEMIYKVGAQLLECGMTIDEAIVVLASSRWNKFAGRRDEIMRLRNGLEKAFQNKFNKKYENFSEEKEREEAAAEYVFLAKSMADVVEEDIHWVWWPYLAKGELTILEGDPDLGKSYVAQMVSLHICDGKVLPSERLLPATRGKVAYFDMENSAGTVTKKRLVHNNIKHLENYFQEEQPFTIDDETSMAHVHEAISKMKPELVVFDTLNTYIGSTDAYRANEAQAAMKNFREIGRRYGCAVLVLRHLTKSVKGPALYRGQGSIAFAGLARVVITAGRVPEEMTEIADMRALAVTKFNLGKKPRALCYTIESDESRGKDGSVFKFHEFVDLTSDDMLKSADENVAEQQREKRTKVDECAEWLHDYLKDGSRDAKDVRTAAEGRSYGNGTLNKAFERVARRDREGFGKGGRWVWSLNPDAGD